MADVSFLNAHRSVRTSAIDGHREHLDSSIGGRDRPAVTKADKAPLAQEQGEPPSPPSLGAWGIPLLTILKYQI